MPDDFDLSPLLVLACGELGLLVGGGGFLDLLSPFLERCLVGVGDWSVSVSV